MTKPRFALRICYVFSGLFFSLPRDVFSTRESPLSQGVAWIVSHTHTQLKQAEPRIDRTISLSFFFFFCSEILEVEGGGGSWETERHAWEREEDDNLLACQRRRKSFFFSVAAASAQSDPSANRHLFLLFYFPSFVQGCHGTGFRWEEEKDNFTKFALDKFGKKKSSCFWRKRCYGYVHNA